MCPRELLQKSLSSAPKDLLKTLYAKNPKITEMMEENEILKLCEFEEILEKEANNLSVNILVKIINNGKSRKANGKKC